MKNFNSAINSNIYPPCTDPFIFPVDINYKTSPISSTPKPVQGKLLVFNTLFGINPIARDFK